MSETLLTVAFSDGSSGTVVGQLGITIKTTDRGQTWICEESGTDHGVYGVPFPAPNTGNAVAAYGAIIRTAAQVLRFGQG